MFGLGHIESRVLFTYQIMFLVLGTVTFVAGLISYVVLLIGFEKYDSLPYIPLAF